VRQYFSSVSVSTRGPAPYPITRDVERVVEKSGVLDGLVTCVIRHTSASLLIQENADPDVLRDLSDFLARVVPRGSDLYRHNAEGPDDMPSHIRCMLTQTTLGIPLRRRPLLLGRWQGIYLFEHRDRPHEREVAIHIIGE
jgi:secondary thiamine-phosphate synthase enzyme